MTKYKPFVSPKYDITNLEAARVHSEQLGGPPIRGQLYRVGFLQGEEGKRVQFIGEYAGSDMDTAVGGEFAYRFILRNPTPPPGIENGTEANPLIVWPLDVWHLQPAQPGDMAEVKEAEVERLD